MKTLSPTQQKIRDFFKSIITYNNATKEETHNFLHNCIKYVFEENGLDIKDFDITIHKDLKASEIDCDGQMTADDNNPKKFDFCFKHNFFKIRNAADVDRLMYPIYVFFHEIGHMMQDILKPDEIEVFDEEKLVSEKALIEMKLEKHKDKEKRLLIKALAKFNNAQCYIGPMEKDADRQSYLYLHKLLLTLLAFEQDEDMIEYLIILFNDLQYTRKQEFIIYRKYSKLNREALEVLKENKLDMDLDLVVLD